MVLRLRQRCSSPEGGPLLCLIDSIFTCCSEETFGVMRCVVLHVLYVVSEDTVFNLKTMQEYRIRHDRAMEEADIVIVYNASITSMLLVRDDSLANPLFFACKTKMIKLPTHSKFTMLLQTIYLPTHSFSIETIRDQPNDPHDIFQ